MVEKNGFDEVFAMASIRFLLVFTLLCTLLTGCLNTYVGLAYITNSGNDSCRDDPEVLSYINGCPTPLWYDDSVSPYDPVTIKNANNQAYGSCYLSIAVSRGNAAALDNLIKKGARPELCAGGFDSSVEQLVNVTCSGQYAYHIKREGVYPTLQRLDRMGGGIEPQILLAKACRAGCGEAARFAMEKGADLNKIGDCKYAIPNGYKTRSLQ